MDEHQFSDAPPIVWEIAKSPLINAVDKLRKIAIYSGLVGLYGTWFWKQECNSDWLYYA